VAEVTLAVNAAGERLDTALAEALGVSRSRAAALIDAGLVTSMGVPLPRSLRVRGGEIVALAEPTASLDPAGPRGAPEAAPGAGGLVWEDIRHVDEAIVVIDKPAGVAAHASPGWNGPTVTAGLAALGLPTAGAGAAEREGIVHRLDVGTSGLMVIARTAAAYRDLKDQFRRRAVTKGYQALVQGLPDPTCGTIDAPIDRHPRARERFAVVAGGRPSITHYDLHEAFPGATLLDVRLETGRTHQIRVHLSALRHPCVGDLRYGADPTLAERLGVRRQWLHAVRLGFRHPGATPAGADGSGPWWEFTSDPAPDLRRALDLLT